jgi:hypothetical protein
LGGMVLKDPVVRCGICGRRNRLLGCRERHGLYSCRGCGAELPAPPTFTSQAIRFSCFCLAAMFIWASWPTSLWLAVALVGAGFLNSRGRWLSRLPANTKIKRVCYSVISEGFEKLAMAAIFVAVGIALVCAAQIAIPLVEDISVSTLGGIEDSLSDLRSTIQHVIGFHTLFVVLTIVVALTLVIPRAPPLLPQVLSFRSSFISIHFVLLGLTSFTFFSASAIEQQEERSMQKLRPMARPYLEERAKLSQEILGASWTEKMIQELRPDQREQMRPYFERKDQGTAPGLQVVQLAIRLAKAAPKLDAKSSASTVYDSEERIRDYLGPNTATTYDSPTLREAKSVLNEFKPEVERLSVFRKAAIEIVAEGLTTFLSGSVDPELVRAFVEELASSLARGSLHNIVPKVENLDMGRAWVQTNIEVPQPTDLGPGPTSWTWDPPDLVPKSAQLPEDLPSMKRSAAPHWDPIGPRPAEPHVPRPPTFEVPKVKLWFPR